MLVLLIRLQLRAPWCQSLKDKRSLTRPLLHKLRAMFNLSAVESGQQDMLNLAQLTLCALAFDAAQADSMEESFYRFVESNTEAEIVLWEADLR